MNEFDNGDFQSETWLKLVLFLEERLANLRARNDANLSTEDTARIRGRIFELKQILALSKSSAPTEMVESE